MTIDKKLIHFKTKENFMSANGVNGNPNTPTSGSEETGNAEYGQIKGTSIVFIKDSQEIWTHGQLYSCSDPDLSNFVTKEELEELEKLSAPMISVTYNELKTLRDNSQLIPGQQYRITDYVTTTSQADTQSAGHPFDVIVTADNENTLNEAARACLHEGDTYFTEAGANLAAWQIWYSLDNDAERFAWASNEDSIFTDIGYNLRDRSRDAVHDGKQYFAWYNAEQGLLFYTTIESPNIDSEVLDENFDPNSYVRQFAQKGKGVIYRMIDEWNNDCPYDFKNIQFKRSIYAEGMGIEKEEGDGDFQVYCYTFSWEDGEQIVMDASIVGNNGYLINDVMGIDGVYGNVIKSFINYTEKYTEELEAPRITQQFLNDIVLLSTYSYDSRLFYGCYSNTFGYGCCSNNLGNKCYSNTFSDDCSENILGDECFNNIFSNGCSFNSFGNQCYSNTFGNNCYRNSFSNSCSSNSLGNDCYSNSFGNDCNSNSFGNNCYYNEFDLGCDNNSFGNICSYNIFGNDCYDNSFGNYCYNNSFGNRCVANSFGNYCQDNILRYDCVNNSFGDEFYDNEFDHDCYSNSFGNSCIHNSFGVNCCYNSFGNGCKYNSFGSSASTTASLKNYCYYNHLDDGCSYNIIWNSSTTGSNIPLQNINVNRGVSGTDSNYNYINVATLNSEKEININNYNGHIYIDYGGAFKVTYLELVDLRDNSQLIPGRQYRITDYVTSTSQKDTKSAEHQFDIIVTAINEYTLSEEAQAIQNINDGYFDDSNLSAWKIWYSLDNDTSRFAWAGDERIENEEVEVITYDSSECTINSDLIDGNAFITPFNFESCVWVDGNGDIAYEGGNNHDEAELVYEWGYFTDEDDNTHLCLYKSDAGLYEEEGQPDYGDKYLYRGVVNVDGTDYDYWQKWDENGGGLDVQGSGDYVFATTPRIVSNPEAYSYETTTETIETVIPLEPKGVIYRMIDEWGNECPYDFKNIMFKHPLNADDTNYYYTFGKDVDCSLNGNCHHNVIKTSYYNIDPNVDDIDDKQHLNYIIMGNGCYDNSFENSCSGNSFGTYCINNSFGVECSGNSFGNSCFDNSFGDNYAGNSLGNFCRDNSFENYCRGNSLGNNCDNNSFGNDCYNNSFGDSCNNNSFGNNCHDNSFENNCYVNSFRDSCYNNSFGDYYKYNSFGNSCSHNSFVSTYTKYCHLDDGCSYIELKTDQTVSSNNSIINVNINRGVKGTSTSDKKIVNIETLNAPYEIQVAKNSKGEIKIYCEADLIA